ncbi:hypothetical protein B566_EDAN009783 [Ephemera danica]|nr:hypothetical protein B566_EDAN009783 [Ephemera danica]
MVCIDVDVWTWDYNNNIADKEEVQQKSWTAHFGARESKVQVISTLRDGYQPVSSMSESTVVVYYQCDSTAVPKQDRAKMRGARRVITFCLLTACLPVLLLILPLYLRNTTFAERHFSLLKHDVIPLSDGISSIFCQRHTLDALEGWFSAHTLEEPPVISRERRETVGVSKMEIPDDKLEYWGFDLLPGSVVNLAVCASTPGARLLVVKGEKNLEICGLLKHTSTPKLPQAPAEFDEESVLITFQENLDEKPAPAAPEDEEERENHGGEVTDPPEVNDPEVTEPTEVTEPSHPVRHMRSKLRPKRDATTFAPKFMTKPDIAHFEGGIVHGGNTVNFTEHPEDIDSSISSFESELLDCFSGKTLFQKGFAAGGKTCETTNSNWTGSLRLKQTVRAQGHFYYVFYSDNDLETNTINARFHINATTYNFTLAAQQCLNVTRCSFDLGFFGGDGTVYVEADSDVLLVSTCEPRLAVYLLFPVCALLFVLIFGLL